MRIKLEIERHPESNQILAIYLRLREGQVAKTVEVQLVPKLRLGMQLVELRFTDRGRSLRPLISTWPGRDSCPVASGYLSDLRSRAPSFMPRVTGPRRVILEQERYLIERFPGPMNNEAWAGTTEIDADGS